MTVATIRVFTRHSQHLSHRKWPIQTRQGPLLVSDTDLSSAMELSGVQMAGTIVHIQLVTDNNTLRAASDL